MKGKRENNMDLLRIMSGFAVVMIHVSIVWFEDAVETVKAGGAIYNHSYLVMACIWNALDRFAVPCFIMLSGSFIVGREETLHCRDFYKKTFRKVGIPALVFSLLYIIYRIPFLFMGGRTGIRDLAVLGRDILTGAPFYHMWYLYMMAGVYVLAPAAAYLRKEVSEKLFARTSMSFLILACLSRWTSRGVRLNWDIGQSFEYLSFFMAGFVLRKQASPNRRRAVLCIGTGIVLLTMTGILLYRQAVAGIGEDEAAFVLLQPYAPLVAVSSVLIFYGFSCLEVRKDFSRLSERVFPVYLIHAGVWDFLQKVCRLTGNWEKLMHLNTAFAIPLITLGVCVISLFPAEIFAKRVGVPAGRKAKTEQKITEKTEGED